MQPIYTQRLILRNWQESDLDDFVKMNQDPRVMEYFPSSLAPAETKALLEAGIFYTARQ